MPDSDAALLRRIPSERVAIEGFYRRHVDAVERFAVRRCHDPGHAAELVSAVFLAVIDSASGYDPRRGTARAWLFGIAIRLLADERRRWWRDERAMRRFAGQAVLDSDDYARGPGIHAALETLSVRDRELFLLVAHDELPVAEAARALGITPVAGRMRLHRARLALKKAIDMPETAAVAEPEGS
jgi:RNA polymerase sigma factor (sigma-70 family)